MELFKEFGARSDGVLIFAEEFCSEVVLFVK